MDPKVWEQVSKNPQFQAYLAAERAQRARILQTDEPRPIHAVRNLVLTFLIVGILFTTAIGSYIWYSLHITQQDFSKHELSNYKVDSLLLAIATAGWHEYKYGNVIIKYPASWYDKPDSLNNYIQVYFVNGSATDSSEIYFADRSLTPFASCEDYFINALDTAHLIQDPLKRTDASGADIVPKKVIGTNKMQATAVVTQKSISTCFKIHGQEFVSSLSGPIKDHTFKSFKQFILFLNSLQVN